MIDQAGCRHVPHVQGIMVGQELLIHNSGTTGHNVKMTSRLNGTFNLNMPEFSSPQTKVFKKDEIGTMALKCDVHPWMSAYVHVLSHPSRAVTQEDATFQLKWQPPGEYELSVWHEFSKFTPDAPSKPVKVEAGKDAEIAFTYRPPAAKGD